MTCSTIKTRTSATYHTPRSATVLPCADCANQVAGLRSSNWHLHPSRVGLHVRPIQANQWQ